MGPDGSARFDQDQEARGGGDPRDGSSQASRSHLRRSREMIPSPSPVGKELSGYREIHADALGMLLPIHPHGEVDRAHETVTEFPVDDLHEHHVMDLDDL